MKICIFGDARSVHVQRISAGLVERGVETLVVTHQPAEIPGAQVERFAVPPPSLRHPHRWRARWVNYLRAFVRDFDVVQVHFLQDWGFTPELIAEGCFVATPWGSDMVTAPGEGEPTPELLAVRRAMLQQADLVTAWGPRFARTVAQFAELDVSTIDLKPLGVDLDLFRRNQESSRAVTSEPSVGFFKGFRPVYGAKVLLHAMATVNVALPGVQWVMIGDGPELAECQELAKTLGVDGQIVWVPRQLHAHLPRYLATWDLAVVPSLQESFGLAALEASAMEMPVVASEVGGLPDTVRDGESGILVPPGEPQRLAEAILRLLNDTPMRLRMGRFGRTMVEQKYDWRVIMDDWVATYHRVREARCVMV